MNKENKLPDNLIVLIAGVPGVGKTTISYELLKKYKEFRLIEETDVIREILRGYNEYLAKLNKLPLEESTIYAHDIFLSYDMAKQQCKIMKNSIINIIKRQQRKRIPSIINGVHIIPEELYLNIDFPNIVYIILYVDSEDALWNRLKNRNPQKYKFNCVPLLYQTNVDLLESSCRISDNLYKVYPINVSKLTIEDTLLKINDIFRSIYKVF